MCFRVIFKFNIKRSSNVSIAYIWITVLCVPDQKDCARLLPSSDLNSAQGGTVIYRP